MNITKEKEKKKAAQFQLSYLFFCFFNFSARS